MLLYNFFAGLAVAASTANAYSYVTVASTTTTVAGTPTATATPTPTSLSRSTSACVGWSCGASTSCLPATTKVVYSICNEKCLGKSTTTSTFTTRPPPITATVPCGVKYLKRALYVEDEPELEKRWTCPPGPTSTSATTLPCPACKVYPHTTVVTTSVVSTNTVYATCPPSSSTPSRTSTSTPPPTSVPTWSMYCFWLCTNSTTRTTIYNSASITTAGWDFCAQACT